MAITYGNTIHHWCAGVEATVTNKSDTVCTVTVKTYWHSIGWGYSVYGHGYSVAGGTQGADSGTVVFSSGTGATVNQLIASTTKNITRTTSDQTITCRGVAIMTGRADANGTSTATTTVTVPKKTSYTVSYNANSGSGAPSSQTKWYGETLKLQTGKPTRPQYNFLRWNTKADGTGTSYASGANYTANATVTLYAQWELAYAYPTISNANVIRTDSSNNAQDDGTYAYLTFDWAVDRTADSANNKISAITWSQKESTTGAFEVDNDVSVDPQATSGSVQVSIGSPYNTDKTYDVRVTVVDTHGGVSVKYLVLTRAFFTFDFGRDGHSIGIGTTASETDDGVVFGAGMPVKLPKRDGTIERNTTNCSSLGTSWLGTNGVVASVSFIDAKIKNALASSGNVVVATLPAGFRPRANRYICCVDKPGLWARITAGGEVRISNDTGGSYSAGSTFTFSDSYYV